MISLKPKSIDHEKRAWSSILEIVEDMRAIDKQTIVGGGAFSFRIAVFNYCLNCHKLQSLTTIFSLDITDVRKTFVDTVSALGLRNSICNECGHFAHPIGNATFICGSMLCEKDSIEKTHGKYGSFVNHPRSKEVYFTNVVTIIGKNKVIIEEIIEGKDGVKFRKLNLENMVGRLVESKEGKFDLSMIEVNLNELVQEYEFLSPQKKSDIQKRIAEVRKKFNA